MVVDVADEARAAIVEHFAPRGWDVVGVRSGIEAITESLTHPVDVIVMSLVLPGLEGFETAVIIRQISPGVRIILMAGAELDARPRERQHTEFFRCFPKPLDLDALARAIGETNVSPGIGDGEGLE